MDEDSLISERRQFLFSKMVHLLSAKMAGIKRLQKHANFLKGTTVKLFVGFSEKDTFILYSTRIYVCIFVCMYLCMFETYCTEARICPPGPEAARLSALS